MKTKLKNIPAKKILPGAQVSVNKEKVIKGSYRGYYISITPELGLVSAVYKIIINATKQTPDNIDGINFFINKQREKQPDRLISIEHMEQAFIITLDISKKVSKCHVAINQIVDETIDFLKLEGYDTGCSICGSNTEILSPFLSNGRESFMCSDCGSNFRRADINSIVKKMKSNIVSGTIGAILGSLVGAAAWVFIYRLGYIAGLVGLVAFVCAAFGYEKLGKVMDGKGVLVTMIVTVVMLYFGHRIAWTWDIYDVYKAEGFNFFECFKVFPLVMEESSGAWEIFYKDLVIGYAFSFLCSIRPIANLLKK